MAHNHDSSASEPRGTPQHLSYKGHKIEFMEGAQRQMPMLAVDGVEIMVQREETGGYSAPMLNMFATYPTLEAMAKQLVDISPVFLAKQEKGI